MTRFNGGTKVQGGYYWNTKAWSITAIDGETGQLEGGANDRFLRLPLPVMLVVAVVVSFGYVIFLPFIGFALLGQAIGAKVTAAFHRTASDVAATMAPAWQPGEAYFAGQSGDAKEEPTKAAEDGLHQLEAELAARRAEEAAHKA